jgi:hypothetical protein
MMPFTGYELHANWHIGEAAQGFRSYCSGSIELFIPGFWAVLDISEREWWCVEAAKLVTLQSLLKVQVVKKDVKVRGRWCVL